MVTRFVRALLAQTLIVTAAFGLNLKCTGMLEVASIAPREYWEDYRRIPIRNSPRGWIRTIYSGFHRNLDRTQLQWSPDIQASMVSHLTSTLVFYNPGGLWSRSCPITQGIVHHPGATWTSSQILVKSSLDSQGCLSLEIDGMDGQLKAEIEQNADFFARAYEREETTSDVLERRQGERKLSLFRTTWGVFREESTGTIKSVGRIYDGSAEYFHDTPWSIEMPGGGHERLPVEREYPGLVLPERVDFSTARKGNKPFLLELGRLAGDDDVTDTLDAELSLLETAHTRHKSWGEDIRRGFGVYATCPASRPAYVRHYRDRKFVIFKTPDELRALRRRSRLPLGPPVFLMRAEFNDLYREVRHVLVYPRRRENNFNRQP